MKRRKFLTILGAAFTTPVILRAATKRKAPAKLGYTGKSKMDGGIIYCPYIPIIRQTHYEQEYECQWFNDPEKFKKVPESNRYVVYRMGGR